MYNEENDMKKIVMALALVLAALTAHGSSQTAVDVDEVFPLRSTYYTKEEFLAGFKTVIHGSLWDDFKAGWCAIYEQHTASQETDESIKRLLAKKETEHIRCFYKSLVQLDFTGPFLIEMQRILIASRFSNKTHILLIKSQNPDLAQRLAEAPQN